MLKNFGLATADALAMHTTVDVPDTLHFLPDCEPNGMHGGVPAFVFVGKR